MKHNTILIKDTNAAWTTVIEEMFTLESQYLSTLTKTIILLQYLNKNKQVNTANRNYPIKESFNMYLSVRNRSRVQTE